MRNTLICDACMSRVPPSRCLPWPRRWTAGAAKLFGRVLLLRFGVRGRWAHQAAGASRTARKPWPRGWRIPATRCLWNWALRLGVERFYDYMERFGIGSATGVDIPGESGRHRHCMKAVVEAACDLARIGFGQSVAVTPIQLLTAACSVVNGGKAPSALRRAGDRFRQDGEVIEQGRAAVRRPAPSPGRHSADTMRQLLHLTSCTDGGGRNAQRRGLHASAARPAPPRYMWTACVSSDTHIGSFIGFAPMDESADRRDGDRRPGGCGHRLRFHHRRALCRGNSGPEPGVSGLRPHAERRDPSRRYKCRTLRA